jgi:hypothetical protein
MRYTFGPHLVPFDAFMQGRGGSASSGGGQYSASVRAAGRTSGPVPIATRSPKKGRDPCSASNCGDPLLHPTRRCRPRPSHHPASDAAAPRQWRPSAIPARPVPGTAAGWSGTCLAPPRAGLVRSVQRTKEPPRRSRLQAARRLGLTHVPVRYLDLSPEDAQLLALADNKLGGDRGMGRGHAGHFTFQGLLGLAYSFR